MGANEAEYIEYNNEEEQYPPQIRQRLPQRLYDKSQVLAASKYPQQPTHTKDKKSV